MLKDEAGDQKNERRVGCSSVTEDEVCPYTADTHTEGDTAIEAEVRRKFFETGARWS